MTLDTRQVQGRAGKLVVSTAGEGGVPVLFVHGNSGNRKQWEPQQEHLKQRSVALDLRGMGESEPDEAGRYGYTAMVEDVEAVADALGLERFVLVGHSFGCAVVSEYAARHPERLLGLVLVDPGPSVKRTPPEELAPFMEGFKPENYESFREGWFSSILQGARPETHRAVMDSLRATPREVVQTAIRSMLECDPVEQLKRYPGPKLAVSAESTLEQLGPKALHLQVPELKCRPMGNVSHWLMMDEPEKFNEELDSFLAQLPGESQS